MQHASDIITLNFDKIIHLQQGGIIFCFVCRGLSVYFSARVTDVSLATMRTLMIVRGKGLIAACIGFFEVIIYITALNKVVSGLRQSRKLSGICSRDLQPGTLWEAILKKNLP
jgi:hypothetical protein